jgi:uncharacterized iron-regulated protein
MTRREILAVAGMTSITGMVGGGASGVANAAAPAPPDGWKVFDGQTVQEMSWESLPGKLATADVIFLGELHDDPETHRAEALLLEAVYGLVGKKLTLAMEMFERDQQVPLDNYLAGKITDAELSKAVKLWRNYETDYRPMVDFAKAKQIPVVGSNAPLRLVRLVSGKGLSAFKDLPDADKPLVAQYINAPTGDRYESRFSAVMGHGHGDSPMEPAMIRRFYEAQCVRDDTMAESIVRVLESGNKVLHVNGSFHSDGGMGTAGRVLWRRPLHTALAIVKIVPYKGTPEPIPYRGEGHYLLFVPDKRPVKS